MPRICDITGWGELDIQALEKWIARYAKIIGDYDDRRAIKCIRNSISIEHDTPAYDINVWLNATIYLLFYQITSHLKHSHRANQKLYANIKRLEQNFCPDINALASSFNNCFDHLDFEQEKESILEQAVGLVGA